MQTPDKNVVTLLRLPFHIHQEQVEVSGTVYRRVACEDAAAIHRRAHGIAETSTDIREQNVPVPVKFSFRVRSNQKRCICAFLPVL